MIGQRVVSHLQLRATIAAYGKGEIELPKVPKNTDTKLIRQASQEPVMLAFTKATVAEFLGWTRSANDGKTLQPNHACEVAFRALENMPERRGRPANGKKVLGPNTLSREALANQFKVSDKAIQQSQPKRATIAARLSGVFFIR